MTPMVNEDFTLLLFLIAVGVTAYSILRWRRRAVLPLALAVAGVLVIFIWRAIEQNAPRVADYARYLASEPLLWLVLIIGMAAQTLMAAKKDRQAASASAAASAADVAVLGQAVTEALAAQQKQISELAAHLGHGDHPAGANGQSHVPF